MRVVIFVLAGVTSTACTSTRCPPNEQGVSACEYSQPVQHTPSVRDSFTLYVSNQSFELDTIDITVALDNNVAVSGDFVVEGQHTWLRFDLGLTPGDHTVKLTTATLPDVALERTFVMDERKYGAASFWYYPEGVSYPEPTPPQFALEISDEDFQFQ